MANNCFTHHSFLRLVLPQRATLVTWEKILQEQILLEFKMICSDSLNGFESSLFQMQVLLTSCSMALQAKLRAVQHSLLWVTADISNCASCSVLRLNPWLSRQTGTAKPHTAPAALWWQQAHEHISLKHLFLEYCKYKTEDWTSADANWQTLQP